MKNEIWIARDLDGDLCLFDQEPTRGSFQFDFDEDKDDFMFFDCNDPSNIIILNPSMFPEVTWENSPKRLILVK